jgi:YVTN family beta-propeller protein
MGQIDVGDGPFFITVDTESHRAYVTNMYDDSISVIDTTTDTVVRTICLSPGDMPVGLTLAH